MNTKTLKFKTNLKCGNCVAKVKPLLDEAPQIVEWSVDLKDPDRIMTVKMDEKGDASTVENILSSEGYKAIPSPE